ncbi:hypothetical protein J1N51_02220 [Psychrosphaera ytuae]|uniref:Uncharacterized protein n=1 Tax=Psychrosphaera ytuae TaxID=2820710 RepID=A0A975DBX9_9GAMM|nr:hypothetical protein [Psychrosphaera ytuae]QTH64322.1 hypothetical protein J1N51_02220 [Psychrosphaera ytuae]
MSQLTKQERLQRAKNKIKLMRRTVDESKQQQLKLRDLVRVYVKQRPEVAVKIVTQWLNATAKR